MNIYIRPDLEEKLRKEPSMSGLINLLLDAHFNDKQTTSLETNKYGYNHVYREEPTYTDPEDAA